MRFQNILFYAERSKPGAKLLNLESGMTFLSCPFTFRYVYLNISSQNTAILCIHPVVSVSCVICSKCQHARPTDSHTCPSHNRHYHAWQMKPIFACFFVSLHSSSFNHFDRDWFSFHQSKEPCTVRSFVYLLPSHGHPCSSHIDGLLHLSLNVNS